MKRLTTVLLLWVLCTLALAAPKKSEVLAAIRQQDWPRAESMLKEATSASPGNPLGWYWYAQVEEKLGKRDAALSNLNHAIQLDPSKHFASAGQADEMLNRLQPRQVASTAPTQLTTVTRTVTYEKPVPPPDKPWSWWTWFAIWAVVGGTGFGLWWYFVVSPRRQDLSKRTTRLSESKVKLATLLEAVQAASTKQKFEKVDLNVPVGILNRIETLQLDMDAYDPASDLYNEEINSLVRRQEDLTKEFMYRRLPSQATAKEDKPEKGLFVDPVQYNSSAFNQSTDRSSRKNNVKTYRTSSPTPAPAPSPAVVHHYHDSSPSVVVVDRPVYVEPPRYYESRREAFDEGNTVSRVVEERKTTSFDFGNDEEEKSTRSSSSSSSSLFDFGNSSSSSDDSSSFDTGSSSNSDSDSF